MPCWPQTKSCNCASNLATSGMRARISLRSSGLDASQSATDNVTRCVYIWKLFTPLSRKPLERNNVRCGMPDKWPWTSSATHHARRKSSMFGSTVMTWRNVGTSCCRTAIMSSNLFISQRSAWSLKRFGWLQVQSLKASPVTVSREFAYHLLYADRECPRDSSSSEGAGGSPTLAQIPACWLMQKAQIQYRRSVAPCASSRAVSN
mmetsp:Transcript_122241/g.345603  ORF Transcript_122241/g.345603 Transcript_122241/m.345603 type:complete len:205 (+) Transcript_122241:157-771(+)